MSRELKFRVWDEKYNQWDNSPIIFYPNEDIKKQGRIIVQYTGLKDSKGKEIYEGDIVKELRFDDWGDTVGYEYRGVVCYKTLDNYDFNNELKFSGVVTFPNLEENQKYIGNSLQTNCEIIGNIFEHSELLK